MTRLLTLITTLALATGLGAGASPPQAVSNPVREPFKLGTFDHRGQTFVGLVLRDSIVINIVGANAALERENRSWRKLRMPQEMKELIGRYEPDGLKQRLYAIVNELADIILGAKRPAYVHDLKAIRVSPPIMYPETLLNAAVNYEEHAREGQRMQPAAPAASEEPSSAPGLWERKPGDTRHNPYLFLKPRSAVIADGEAIRIPPGRDRIDWECEMAVVIGRRVSRVPIEQANEYIFGYTLENDVSDRGEIGRAHV